MTQHMRMATMTRAMQLARGAVKAELRKHGVRLAEVEARDITSWALVYLDDNPELVAEARPVIEACCRISFDIGQENVCSKR
jgi:hypothetical protein